MKMFKRFAAALLAGVMVLAMLTACGGGAGGAGESEFEKKVQDVYMSALNTTFNTSYENNQDVKALAASTLNNIVDGKVASKGAAVIKTIENGKSILGTVVCVKDAEKTQDTYTALYCEEATASAITADGSMISYIKYLVDTAKEAGEKNNTNVSLTGLGVATKTVEGKTYIAVGFKLSK